jgi:beta-galactosidase GanA
VAKAGKAEYPLPMYANAWLVQNEEQMPGDYPSGGPVSRVMDVWRAAAPQIDLLAPDIYLTDFKAVCAKYVRSGNPLMIPEARRGPEAARNVFWAVAEHDTLCFAPFGIESIECDPLLANSYRLLRELIPVVTAHQGSDAMAGILQQDPNETGTEIVMGDYRAKIRYHYQAKDQTDMAYGLIINLAPNDYLIAGNWFEAVFSPVTAGPSHAGILEVWEGHYQDGRWVPGRCLNGDETLAHSRVRLPPNKADLFAGPGRPRTLRVTLYRHD